MQPRHTITRPHWKFAAGSSFLTLLLCPTPALAGFCSSLANCLGSFILALIAALAVVAIVVVLAWAASALAGLALDGLLGEGLLEGLTGVEITDAEALEWESLESSEINEQVIGDAQRGLLKDFFGSDMRGALARDADFQVPQGLTERTLRAYSEIAQRVIDAGKDASGVQVQRLALIARALGILGGS